MRKIVLSGAVLLGLLLIGSTSLAEAPGKDWWTEFTSDVFTISEEGFYEYRYTGEGVGTLSYTVEVTEDALLYPGTALLRPWSVRVRTDEPGLNCANLETPRIRPGQPVRFHIAWVTDEPMSRRAADALFDTLSYTVSWDAQSVLLDRQFTHLYYEDIDLMTKTCLWTLRP